MTMHTSTRTTDSGVRLEGVALVLILLAVGGMAGAASFRHVHDWTMHNVPAGTGDWFGWANAVISDLVPLGVGLEVRRRRRLGLPIGAYPITIIICAAALSLAGQLAEAKPGPSGWLLAAVPALGFLALTKLVLSRPTPSGDTTTTATIATSATATDVASTDPSTAVATAPDDTTPADLIPANQADDPTTDPTSRPEAVPTGLLPGARTIAASHRKVTGEAITPLLLAERMNLPTDVAGRILAALGEHIDRAVVPTAATNLPVTPTVHNGHPYPGAGR
jgi:hypothetical protein